MFIRAITKKNPGYDKTFTYHRLMESIRTPKGPRQRVLLNLGYLDLPSADWKTLANRIEEILLAQASFLAPPIGRLRERYPTIARFYNIEVGEETGRATQIKWSVDSEKALEARFSGAYYIRSSRTDLAEKELWSLYMMLGEVEESFRCLKSELGLRPVYHRKDPRQEGHLFITVLAYHLLATIQRELKGKGILHRWGTLRTRLSTHMRATASVTNEKGERIYLRQTGDPEPFHLEIYRALGLPANPLKTKRIMKM